MYIQGIYIDLLRERFYLTGEEQLNHLSPQRTPAGEKRMYRPLSRTLLSALLLAGPCSSATGGEAMPPPALDERIENLTQQLNQTGWSITRERAQETLFATPAIRIENCQRYPYHDQTDPVSGFRTLLADLRQGLRQGLRCLAGVGPMGRLHAYHRKQAAELTTLLESEKTKTFRCVADQTFVNAIATAPKGVLKKAHFDQISGTLLDHPGVLIDTYRISGFLTRKLEPQVYRDFFKLDEQQIVQHLTGKPLKLDGMHRFKNRPALLFHEMTHWLGHLHTNNEPDMADLYETCCFGGSDYIADHDSNREFQNRACAILKDDNLWNADKAQQQHQWRYKGYVQLKRDMRQLYY
jgi:hypothetical protein